MLSLAPHPAWLQVRREAKEAAKAARDQQVAALIAGADVRALTLEQQRAMLEAARASAEASTSAAAAARLQALSGRVVPPTVRATLLGEDGEGRRYLQLASAPLLAGAGHVVVHAGPEEGGTARDADEALACQPDAAALAAALHERGRREGPLRAAIAHAFKLKLGKQASAAAPAADAGASRSGGGSPDGGEDGAAGGASQSEGAGAANQPSQQQRQQQQAQGEGQASGGKGKSGGSPAADGSRERGFAKRGGRRGAKASPPATRPANRAEPAPPAKQCARKRVAAGDAAKAGRNDDAAPAPPSAKRGRKGARAGAAVAKESSVPTDAKKGGRRLPRKVDDMVEAEAV